MGLAGVPRRRFSSRPDGFSGSLISLFLSDSWNCCFFPPLYSLNRAVTKTDQLMWLRSASSHLVCGDAAGWALSAALSLSRIWLLQKQKNLFQEALTEWPEWSELNLSARSSMHRILLPCVVSVTGFHQCCSACTCKSMNATIMFLFFAKLCNKMICLCLQALNTSKQLF